MKCPNCEAPLPAPPGSGISGEVISGEVIVSCPQCGFPVPSEDESEPTLVGFDPKRSRPGEAVRSGAASETERLKEPDPVLGIVVTYSETAKGEGDGDSRLGRVYALRAGQVLFVGKGSPAPAQVRRADGVLVAPVASHLYPRTREFGFISSQHLTVEMEPDGPTVLTDTSTNGFYFTKTAQYVRRRENTEPQVHRVLGDEIVVLAINLAEPGAGPEMKDLAERFQLRILRPPRSVARSKSEEGTSR